MSKAEARVAPELLHELLKLDVDTGKLFWLAREEKHFSDVGRSAKHRCANWNSKFAWREAFYTVDLHGYRHGYIFNAIFSAARVVFAMHHGKWPSHHIDHINGNKTDDRPVNLRDVHRQENMRNRALSINSQTGSHGVSLHLGKFDAYITDCKKKKHLGRFSNQADAIAARKIAEAEFGYHQNHGRITA